MSGPHEKMPVEVAVLVQSVDHEYSRLSVAPDSVIPV